MSGASESWRSSTVVGSWRGLKRRIRETWYKAPAHDVVAFLGGRSQSDRAAKSM